MFAHTPPPGQLRLGRVQIPQDMIYLNLLEFGLFPSTLLLENMDNKALHLFCPEACASQSSAGEVTECQLLSFPVGMMPPVNVHMEPSARIHLPPPEVWDSGQRFSCCVVTHSRAEHSQGLCEPSWFRFKPKPTYRNVLLKK